MPDQRRRHGRETIERIASNLYDEAPRFKGYVVRIFTKHLGK